MKRARVEKEDTLGLLGLNEDGAVLMGAKTAAFAGCRVNDVLPEQSEEQMLAFQLLMARALGQRLCRDDGGPGLFGELFRRGLHRSFDLELIKPYG